MTLLFLCFASHQVSHEKGFPKTPQSKDNMVQTLFMLMYHKVCIHSYIIYTCVDYEQSTQALVRRVIAVVSLQCYTDT
jgi:hypothetical protein